MTYSLKETKKLIDEAFDSLDWQVTAQQNNAYSYFSGGEGIRRAVENLGLLGLFTDTVNQLTRSALYSYSGNDFRIQTAQANEISSLAQRLKADVANIKLIIDELVPNEAANSINIKLPHVKSFKDLSTYASSFHTALTQVLYLPNVNGDLTIESVENGSIWLNVLIEGEHAMKTIGELVYSAAVVYKQLRDAKNMVFGVKGLKGVPQTAVDEIEKAQDTATKEVAEKEAELIASHLKGKVSPEDIGRIKNALRTLADLLDEGAEIYPALNSPQEIADQFPDMKTLPTIESKTKLLSPPGEESTPGEQPST